jgi:hypothetical protein
MLQVKLKEVEMAEIEKLYKETSQADRGIF